MCSSAFENVPYSLENYTVKNEQLDQLKKILQFVTPKKKNPLNLLPLFVIY